MAQKSATVDVGIVWPDARRVVVRPGDVVVVEVPQALSHRTIAEVERQLNERFPGARAMILDGGATIRVLAKEVVE